MTHTPLPWHIEPTTSDELGVDICAGPPRGEGDHVWIGSVCGTHDNSKGFVKTTEECLANAAFIVKAVNAHEELLKYTKCYRAMLSDKWLPEQLTAIDKAIALEEGRHE